MRAVAAARRRLMYSLFEEQTYLESVSHAGHMKRLAWYGN